jgi:hypothetical protein
MYTQEDIDNFIKQTSGGEVLKPNDDLMNDQGIGGDDFHELIDKYAKTFNVDMAGYLWYFHADEEGGLNSIGSSFFKPPYERVDHIPVTPEKLLDFANKGCWDMEYPPHKLPKRRWDLVINGILFIIFLGWALYSCFK